MGNEDKPGSVRIKTNGAGTRGKVTAPSGESYALKFLDWNQVPMVDEALRALGEYGEVRLVVEKGRLRFLVTQKSIDALKWQPGDAVE